MIKKHLFNAIIILFLSLTNGVNAQNSSTVKADSAMLPMKDTSWHRGMFTSITFNQVGLTNWAAGGESSLSLSSTLNAWDNYKKGKVSWDNSINLGYGLLEQAGGETQKNTDNIELNSIFGHLIKGKFYLSVLANFKSQFARGYNYPNDSVVVSKFAAPAYITLALGVDYKPASWFSMFLSPATGRYIIVQDQVLADSGAYGVTPAVFDVYHNLITHGKMYQAQFGAYFKMKFQKDIFKGVNFGSNLTLFNNYTDAVPAYRKDVVVTWDNMLNIKTGKFLTTSFVTNMIYDHSVDVPIYKTINGVQTIIGKGPRLQFREILGIGISYRISNRPEKK